MKIKYTNDILRRSAQVEASYEIEKIVDKLQRYTFAGFDHEFVDTCDIYYKVLQEYRKSILFPNGKKLHLKPK